MSHCLRYESARGSGLVHVDASGRGPEKGAREMGVAGLTLNCRVVLVDEMALDQLDRQARFTDTTTADDDELVLSQELSGAKCQQSNIRRRIWRRAP